MTRVVADLVEHLRSRIGQDVDSKFDDEIRRMGGEATANGDDISEWSGAERVIKSAVETFGELHVVVNNAGILRDRMLVNMTPDEWDAVIKVHLRGTFCMNQQAAVHWRELSKAGLPVDARIINTTSPTGLRPDSAS